MIALDKGTQETPRKYDLGKFRAHMSICARKTGFESGTRTGKKHISVSHILFLSCFGMALLIGFRQSELIPSSARQVPVAPKHLLHRPPRRHWHRQSHPSHSWMVMGNSPVRVDVMGVMEPWRGVVL